MDQDLGSRGASFDIRWEDFQRSVSDACLNGKYAVSESGGHRRVYAAKQLNRKAQLHQHLVAVVDASSSGGSKR